MFWNIGATRQNSHKLILLLGIMLSGMLLPSFPISAALPRIRLDEVFLFGALGLNIAAFLVQGRKINPYDLEVYHERQAAALRNVNLVFLVLVACMVISNIYAVLVLKSSFGVRDVMEFVTVAKYYLVTTLVISIEFEAAEYQILTGAFLAAFALIVLLSWGQFLNAGNMNAWLTPLLAPSHLNNLVNANPPRILGTFDNPNVMGIFAVFTLGLLTTWFYFREDSRRSALLLFVLSGLTIKLAFMTISRTALLATAAILSFLSLWALFRRRWNRGIIMKVALLFLLTVTLFVTSPRDFTTRMSEATNVQKSTSAIGHMQRWSEAWDVIKKSPVLGWGTAKSSMTTLVDDEYVLIARRYGFVGLLAYLWFFLRPALAAWRQVKRLGRTGTDFQPGVRPLLAIAFTAATIAVLIYNLTAGIFYNLQLMTLYAIFMGLIYSGERETV